MGLWQVSPSWMKSNSHSLKEPKSLFHVYFAFERERKDPVVMHPDITVWLLTFLYSPDVPFMESKRLQKWTTTVSHLGCAATTQTAVLELRFSDQQLSGHSLDPGTETETTLGRPPSDTILGTSLRIQTFYLTGSVSTLEHKYSSPESGSV